MKYITSQQDTTYFHWQIETYLNNFEKVGIDLNQCHVVLIYENKISDTAKVLVEKYREVNFHFYKMPFKGYVAAVKPYGMWQLSQEIDLDVVFYHDADIIFTEPINFDELIEGETSYMSVTLQRGGKSYIDLEYLSEFEGVIDGLTDIIGVEPKQHGGGAQYILKGMPSEYWEKVYKDCFPVHDFLKNSKTKVQVWCAEMWSTLWNVWYFGKEIELHSKLDFCMSRDPIEELKPIVHNAGIMDRGYFAKGSWRNRYPRLDLEIKKDMCNYVYYKEISYIRAMGKIKIIKDGAADAVTRQVYKIGDVVDLGDSRNENAVKGGYAEFIKTEKKEGKPKRTKRTKK